MKIDRVQGIILHDHMGFNYPKRPEALKEILRHKYSAIVKRVSPHPKRAAAALPPIMDRHRRSGEMDELLGRFRNRP